MSKCLKEAEKRQSANGVIEQEVAEAAEEFEYLSLRDLCALLFPNLSASRTG